MEKGNAVLVFELDGEKDARVLFDSIIPEVSEDKGDRCTESMEIDKNTIILKIESKDGPSFRASLSSHMRWIKVSTALMEI